MLINGYKTGSKLGNFPKITNLFNQNGRGQGVVKIREKHFLPKMFKMFGPNSSHIILFGQSQLPQFCNFLFFALKKRLS